LLSILADKEREKSLAIKAYESLFALYGAQKSETIFAHFYPKRRLPADPPDYDEPFNVFCYRLPPERVLSYAQK